MGALRLLQSDAVMMKFIRQVKTSGLRLVPAYDDDSSFRRGNPNCLI